MRGERDRIPVHCQDIYKLDERGISFRRKEEKLQAAVWSLSYEADDGSPEETECLD
jgi:hypothetical protein